MEKRILLLSDLHLCHIDWHGMDAHTRLTSMVEQVRSYHEDNPIDEILLLGDYSLDFWQWSIGGSFLHDPPVSNTERFVETFVSRLPIPPKMLPGNHEQYGNETWKRITGFDRQFSLTIGDWRVLMLDTFAGNLDPTVNSDGTYTGPDEAFLLDTLAQDDRNVILCAHHFNPALDSPSVRERISREPRIKVLFSGHTHESCVEDYLGKPHIRDGHYSYTKGDIRKTMWGFREVILRENSLETVYITPKNELMTDSGPYHHPGGKQDAWEI